MTEPSSALARSAGTSAGKAPVSQGINADEEAPGLNRFTVTCLISEVCVGIKPLTKDVPAPIVAFKGPTRPAGAGPTGLGWTLTGFGGGGGCGPVARPSAARRWGGVGGVGGASAES